MDHPVLVIAMRFVHIASAIAAMGGLMFGMLCLARPLKAADPGVRETLGADVRRRFSTMQWIAILGLVISGTYNWILNAGLYKEVGPIGNALIGTKVLLAAILFIVVWAKGSGIIKSERAAQMINIHLGAIIIILAAVLRHVTMTHLQSPA